MENTNEIAFDTTKILALENISLCYVCSTDSETFNFCDEHALRSYRDIEKFLDIRTLFSTDLQYAYDRLPNLKRAYHRVLRKEILPEEITIYGLSKLLIYILESLNTYNFQEIFEFFNTNTKKKAKEIFKEKANELLELETRALFNKKITEQNEILSEKEAKILLDEIKKTLNIEDYNYYYYLEIVFQAVIGSLKTNPDILEQVLHSTKISKIKKRNN
jgi:hypothetical protein